MKLKFKKLNPLVNVPYKGSDSSAGLDLYAFIESGSIDIAAESTEKISTGLSFEIPEGYFGAIFARSGMATKRGLRPANCVGVVDSDYRGEVIVALHNDSNECQTIHSGDRIAQLVLIPYLPVELHEEYDLSDTRRGDGGFGSTGTN